MRRGQGRIAASRRNQAPSATYRVQFCPAFRFRDARRIAPYLQNLGITHLYASPVFESRAGSAHGYDVVDPTRVDPELGSEAELRRLRAELRKRGMGIVLDIVPNHMAACPANRRWWDVLRRGRESPFARWFDIRWEEDPDGKVVVPVLAAPYRDVLRTGRLTPEIGPDGFVVRYYEHRFPLDAAAGLVILDRAFAGRTALAGGRLRGLLAAWRRAVASRTGLSDDALVRRLWRLRGSVRAVRRRLDGALAALAHDPGGLDALIAAQSYRLGYWRETSRINYRRFFDVDDLIGVRVGLRDVFEATHALVFRLVRDGVIDGLRVDHVDGLRDPAAYLRDLRRRSGRHLPAGRPRPWIVIEKILGADEALRPTWAVAGTTGYDFMAVLGGLLVDRRGFERLVDGHGRWTGDAEPFGDGVYRLKRELAEGPFAAGAHGLAERLRRLAPRIDARMLREAFLALSATLDVYRTYVRKPPVDPLDRERLDRAVRVARRRLGPGAKTALEAVRRIVVLRFPGGLDVRTRRAWVEWVKDWQQWTGPLTAKAVEDTALYRYSPLLSLNEVGCEPVLPRDPVARFHRRNRLAASRWPRTMNATSTHDTKRSEDVRARIHVLAEIPDEWQRRLEAWSRMNRRHRRRVGRRLAPDRNEESVIYQTMLGAWPLDDRELPDFRARLAEFVVKAVREAGIHSSWTDVDARWEGALQAFLGDLLRDERGRFAAEFYRLRRTIAWHGALNSLSQVVLKIASPGVPDFYQGCELWDFSLVDPDNRRPVDFTARRRALRALERDERRLAAPRLCRRLLESWTDGRIKLFVTRRALRFRRDHRRAFDRADYMRLRATGLGRRHVCAFARRAGRSWIVAVVPRLTAALVSPEQAPCGSDVWGGSAVLLPTGAPRRLRDVFTGQARVAEPRPGRHGTGLPVAAILGEFPVALLHG